MTSALKIEQLYQSGNQELALELLNTLSDYSCIRYLLINLGGRNLRLMVNSPNYSLNIREHAIKLFAYINIK